MPTSDEALAALLALDEEELATYCRAIEIDGAIAQVLRLKLDKGQELWVSRGGLMAYQGISQASQGASAASAAPSGPGELLLSIEPSSGSSPLVLAIRPK